MEVTEVEEFEMKSKLYISNHKFEYIEVEDTCPVEFRGYKKILVCSTITDRDEKDMQSRFKTIGNLSKL